jgi:hypothetical protein
VTAEIAFSSRIRVSVLTDSAQASFGDVPPVCHVDSRGTESNKQENMSRRLRHNKNPGRLPETQKPRRWEIFSTPECTGSNDLIALHLQVRTSTDMNYH